MSHGRYRTVGNETGEVFVPTYDWQEKFARVKSVPQLKKFHHFVFDAEHPGIVKCYLNSGDEKIVSYNIMHPEDLSSELPTEIVPCGLSQERQKYLFDKIRQFCPDHCKDILCPP